MAQPQTVPTSQRPIDFDGAWKEALELEFPAFMAFVLPEAYAAVDWRRGYEFLDQELRQLAQEGELGRRSVDKLVKVWRNDGTETWVLVHVEVQSQRDSAFAERMYVYNYRIYDRYRRQVASLAVLGYESPTWRPERFGYDLWGCHVEIRFPVVKLADYRSRWAELAASTNPFAVVVMAHLKTQETMTDLVDRKRWKWAFTRRLYELGLNRERVIRLYRFIEWLMWLPADLQAAYWQEVKMYEQEQATPFISYAEQIGIEQGIEQGLEQGLEQGIEQGKREGFLAAIELGLELRFGSEGVAMLADIAAIDSLSRLQMIYTALRQGSSLDEIRLLCEE